MDPVMHNPRVSYDLLRPIFEHLESDKASLCAISLTCSTFRDEGQRILFREVKTLRRYTSHLKFLRTVAASPTRLALFVHVYVHFWKTDWGSVTIEDFVKDLQNVVGDGFKAMSRLNELILFCPDSLHYRDAPYIPILSACTFRLERFYWRAWDNLNELVEKFFISQPTLKHLCLYNADELPIVPSTICPQLVSIIANWNVIKAFLPGHNLSILHTDQCDSRDMMNIKPLTAELKRVKILSIRFKDLCRITLLGLDNLRCLSSLESLITERPRLWDSDEGFRVEPTMPQLISILSELPALQTLTLTGRNHLGNPEEDIELTRNLFAKFGEHLKCIDIADSGLSDLYSRYIQSQETIQKVSESEAQKRWL